MTADRRVGEAVGGRRGAADVDVAPIGPEHERWVARLHAYELPHGLFPRLGASFVRRWQRAQLASPDGIGFVALRRGEPVGFVLGSTDRRATVDWIIAHRRFELAVAGAGALLCRPAMLLWFLRTRSATYARRLLGRRTPTDATSTASGSVAVLDAVAVTPDARGAGAGTALVGAFLSAAAGRGVDKVELITKEGDGGAAGFYERRGWTVVAQHTDRDGDTGITFRIDPRGSTDS